MIADFTRKLIWKLSRDLRQWIHQKQIKKSGRSLAGQKRRSGLKDGDRGMVHKDGVKAEDFFEEFCKQNGLDADRIHQPFDFLVNGRLVEVKSARLFVKQYKDGQKIQGRYECWRKSQHTKLKHVNPWVCFIITHEHGCLIQGFAKARDWPKSLKLSISNAEKMGLKSIKQFLQYVK